MLMGINENGIVYFLINRIESFGLGHWSSSIPTSHGQSGNGHTCEANACVFHKIPTVNFRFVHVVSELVIVKI